MIQACRYLAYAILFIGSILCLVGGLSFVIDIHGMTMNGRPVESHEDKIVFFWSSIGFVSGALVSIAILRREVLQRSPFVWRAAYWADTLPSKALAGGPASLWPLLAFGSLPDTTAFRGRVQIAASH